MSNFTHLHVHTQYSILDGQADVGKLIERAQELGMDALAISDHGAMYGVFDFHNRCLKSNIKPLIGFETYVAEGSRFDKNGREDNQTYHLLLLAKNAQGYQNLCRLSSLAFREGFYYKPRVDKEILAKYHEGVIACSACLGGELPKFLMAGQLQKAEEALKSYLEIYGDDFYIEIQNHGLHEQAFVNPQLIDLARKYGVKTVATNDVHFVRRDDFEAHKILVCLNTGSKLTDDHKMMYSGEEYLKSKDEMLNLFPEHQEAVYNTQEIVDKIEVFPIQRDIILPKFPLPEGIASEMDYLRKITFDGAKERWGEPCPPDILERLNFELDTVEKMGFPGYFLIVWDFICAARKMGVLVGPGRGSAAGSAVTYAIGITNVDPIKYKLLFERFLNPERISMPDMDIDFDDAGRERVIQYVVEKYGADCVAQIITFGTMAAKSSIKDVARVLDLPLDESNRLANLVPKAPGITLKKAMKEEPQLAAECQSQNPLIAKTLDFAVQLEGSLRSTGTHACGMIIAPENLMNVVPLSTAKGTDMPVVQFEGTLVESAGLLKMDFLGLSTLNIIKNALVNIEKRHGTIIDIEKLPLEDAKTYELFTNGETVAIFQFESEGMRKNLMELKPTCLEDLIAMNALYRPGPMDYIPDFIARKQGTKAIAYDLPEMQEVLEETYGICVYQEQVMLLSQKLANFTKGDADSLRKAMGKKQIAVLEKMFPKYLSGCETNGHDRTICEKIWKDWEAFASYAFNKSHATCYAYIAFQTAYLKAHYPSEFMAAALTNDLNDIKKITFLMEECRHMKIRILPPDVNESRMDFTVNTQGNIRFGLAAIKGVGEGAVEELIAEREKNGDFKDLFDFIQRVDLRKFNKKNLESLAKAGAFDEFLQGNRAVMFASKGGDSGNFLDNLVAFGAKAQKDSGSAQASLFDDQPEIFAESNPEIPFCEPWTAFEKLKYEKEITGLYLSGHPLDAYRLEQRQFANCKIADFKDQLKNFNGKPLRFVGMMGNVQHLISKKGTEYGRFLVSDFDESIEFSLFTGAYTELKNYLRDEVLVMIDASVRKSYRNPEECELKIEKIEFLEDYLDKHLKQLVVVVQLKDINPEWERLLADIAQRRKGPCPWSLEVRCDELQCLLEMPCRKGTVDARAFIEELFEANPKTEIRLK